jgi:nitroreductase
MFSHLTSTIFKLLMPAFKKFSYSPLLPEEQLRRAKAMREQFEGRRSLREFSDAPIDREVLEEAIRTASTAPSGAHKQPWKFVVVTDPAIKHKIRVAAEKEEKESYEKRMPQEWLDDLEPFGTDWHKEFLDIAPALVVVFAQNYARQDGQVRKHYYVKESVGIAVGFFLAALHNAGLVALTHTPSPMDFLGQILERPESEKAFLLIPVGYPADDAVVPDIQRKSLQDILVWK